MEMFGKTHKERSARGGGRDNRKRLYQYRGNIVSIKSYGKTVTEIVLGDIKDYDKAPIRLSVSGGLARYIYQVWETDAEERYIPSDWYFDRSLYLNRIEIPGKKPHSPAKVIAQEERWTEDVVIYSPSGHLETCRPKEMRSEDMRSVRSFIAALDWPTV